VQGLVALGVDDLVVIGNFVDAVDFATSPARDVRLSNGDGDIFVRRIKR
jgi:hypothetical protein